MSHDKYDDDPCIFARCEALWVNRIIAESLISGEGWDHIDKRKAAGKILFEATSSIEKNDIKQDIGLPSKNVDMKPRVN